MMVKKKKAQTTIEILIIFGVLVLGAIFFGLFYINNLNNNLGGASELSNDQSDYMDITDSVSTTTPYVDDPEDPGITDPVFCDSGDGTINNPLVICTAKELEDIRVNLNYHYVLGQDIDLNHALLSSDPTATWYDDTNGWNPIGTDQARFTGSLDGNMHSINNLYINRPETSNIGLFGYTTGNNSIKDLTLNNVFIVGKKNVGALIGVNFLLVDNCNISGIVKGVAKTGGLIGYSEGQIKNSGSEGEVHILPGDGDMIFNMEFHFVGGLIGVSKKSVDDCYSKANIHILENGTYNHVGGLIGISTSSVSNSYSKNNAHNDLFVFEPSVTDFTGRYIGGLIGSQDTGSEGNITNSYSERNIITFQNPDDKRIGGLLGAIYGNSIIDCNVTGDVIAGGVQQNLNDWSGGIGGIVGYMCGDLQRNTLLSANFTGDVVGHTRVGGIVGEFAGAYGGYDEQIKDSKVIGNISGVQSVGGLIGAGHTDIIDSSFSGVINGSRKVGGLAGFLGEAEKVCVVFNSNTSGEINAFGPGTSNYSVGGLIGENEVLISDSYSRMDIDTNASYNVGGLVGSTRNAIYDSHYIGNILAPETDYVGGLAGSLYFISDPQSIISKCYADSNITASQNVGGFVGNLISEYIYDSYSKGQIYATGPQSTSGGFVGNNDHGKIVDSYSTVLVDNIDNEFIGGFVGFTTNVAGYSNCFWDTELTNIPDTNGAGIQYINDNLIYGGTPIGIYGKPTSEMKDRLTFKYWNFTTIWEIETDITYPNLKQTNPESRENIIDQLRAKGDLITPASVCVIGEDGEDGEGECGLDIINANYNEDTSIGWRVAP